MPNNMDKEKEEYLSQYREWRSMFPNCATEEELSQEWDQMKPKQRRYALSEIKTTVIVGKAAQRAGESRRY